MVGVPNLGHSFYVLAHILLDKKYITGIYKHPGVNFKVKIDIEVREFQAIN